MSPHLSQWEKFQDSILHWKMHSHSFLELNRHHAPEVHGQRYDHQLQDLHKAPQINRVHHGKSRCFFNVVTPGPTLLLPLQWQQKTLDLKLFHTLHIAQIWHHEAAVETGFKNSLKSFTAMGSMGLFIAGDVSEARKTTWKNEVQKQSTHFELWRHYFLKAFVTVLVQLVSLIKELPQYLHIHFINFI
jgi:hypothetical protein